MTLVLVDLDGTLIGGPSSESVLLSRLLREGVVGLRQLASGLGFLLRWAPRGGAAAVRRNKAYLAGLPVPLVRARARDLVQETLLGRVRPSMRERVEAHRRRGQTLVLLTGAPDFIAGPMADALAIPHCVATLCSEQDGHFVARPPLRHPYGAEKARIAEALCREFGCALDDCVAYADSINDAALLHRVGQPVSVHPDRRLSRVARRAGWPIVVD